MVIESKTHQHSLYETAEQVHPPGSIGEWFVLLENEHHQLEHLHRTIKPIAEIRGRLTYRLENITSYGALFPSELHQAKQMLERMRVGPKNPKELSVRYSQFVSSLSEEMIDKLKNYAQILGFWQNITNELRFRHHLGRELHRMLVLMESKVREFRNLRTISYLMPEQAQACQEAEGSGEAIESLVSVELTSNFDGYKEEKTMECTESMKDHQTMQNLYEAEGAISDAHKTPSDTMDAHFMPENKIASKLPAGAEQRRSIRLSLGIDVEVGDGASEFFTGFSENISTGGLFVATYQTLPKMGQTFSLNFVLPNGEKFKDVEGEVAWVREYSVRNPELSPGFGLKFTNLTLEQSSKINLYILKEGALFFPE